MAPSLSSARPLLLLCILFSIFLPSHQQPPLNSGEQESVYLALESINSDIPWRTIFADDLCLSAPHGVVCDYFPEDPTNATASLTPHIIELSFGFVSDYSSNPPCSPNSTFPLSVSSLSHLRKLFFYRCFTQNPVRLPDFGSTLFGSGLEELVFVDNPSLSGSLNSTIGKFKSLRRLILSGSNVSGPVPPEINGLSNLEQLTLSGNNLNGELPINLGELKKLRLLDLSHNGFGGRIPESIGKMGMLLKLDLSSNNLEGKIPQNLKVLQILEFLDLSFNNFGNFGVPQFLGEMPRLKEVYLSGNHLGGAIPEIWEKLGGILGIGLSGVGLVGNIPASMGVFLRNAIFIALDNNNLEGKVPMEFELLGNLHEMYLQNNQLSGRIPFSSTFAAGIGSKLNLEGNPELCVDKGLTIRTGASFLRNVKICNESEIPNPTLFNGASSSLRLSWYLLMLLLVGHLGLFP
ncbi:hypothetical protein Nepgr_027784 [Nepenthes gracilis]|uniref:Piriformospora indica-insensitive protein 2 n=1 Tax=Nepenthes gracilis TaxID=150966 RepID=A0AAD3TC00_NEPGR|nr:hypothetical protein Nepgr_027784 [Nepenthes gracilis]